MVAVPTVGKGPTVLRQAYVPKLKDILKRKQKCFLLVLDIYLLLSLHELSFINVLIHVQRVGQKQ